MPALQKLDMIQCSSLSCIIQAIAERSVVSAWAGIHSGVGYLTWIPVFTGLTAAD